MTEGYPPEWQQDVSREESRDLPTGGGFVDGENLRRDGSTAVAGEHRLEGTQDPSGNEDQGKAGAAKEQAAAVGQGAAEAGQQVAAVAKDQAQNVAAEAGSQAKDLLDQARSELTDQAGSQQQRLAQTLRSLGQELESMGRHSEEPGMATDVVKQASGRAHDAASWLESREPGSLLGELQSFARQRPAAFLALAAGAGLVAGRLGRGVKDATGDSVKDATGDSVKDATGDGSGDGSAGAAASNGSQSYASTGVVGGVDSVAVAADEPRAFASSQDDFVNEAGYRDDAGFRTTYANEGGL